LKTEAYLDTFRVCGISFEKAVIFKVKVHQGIVSYPSCVFKEMGINQIGVNKNDFLIKNLNK
jgi:hypothetical protein